MHTPYGSIYDDNGGSNKVYKTYTMPIKNDEEGEDNMKEIHDGRVCLKKMKRSVSTWWRKDYFDNDIEKLFKIKTKATKSEKEGSLFWKLLGFEENPIASNETNDYHVRNSSSADLRLSMLSNFSTSYNIVSISLALGMMSNVYDTISSSDRSLCSSALLAGMIFGQLAGGTIGDILGRHIAMTVVMFLQIVASFATALPFSIQYLQVPFLGLTIKEISIFKVLACWRFILGVGCGGVYPLAATITAESSTEKENRGKLVALTFSMQGVGYFTVSLFAYILVSILGDKSDLAWRLLLGSGCLPGVFLTYTRFMQRKRKQGDSKEKKEAQSPPNYTTISDAVPDLVSMEKEQALASSIIEAITTEENLIQKLVGTAGCWFFFDILFYGNTLFQPVVLSAAFGSSETVQKTARDTCVIAALSLPGYFISIASIGKQSPKYIQMQGFMFMAVLYFIIGFWFEDLARMKMLLLTLYGSTFFFSNYGPNATTFMLPSMTFSKPCRSTLNGISAASGKAGALFGAILFEPVAITLGNNSVMIICAMLSLLSFILTLFFVSGNVGLGATTLDSETKKGLKNEVVRQRSDGYNNSDKLITLEPEYEDPSYGYVAELSKMERNKSAPSLLDL